MAAGVIQTRPVSPSQNTAVVCDTTAYLPAELIERHGVSLVSLYVRFGEEQQRESEITDYDAFYERVRVAEDMPTTSQPSVGDFLETYEPLLETGREIVSIHISSGISGTYESAIQAKQRLTEDGRGGERMRVVDSESTGGGLGLVVLAACAAAEAGADADAVIEQAAAAREGLKMWFGVDTLEYLRRGGRIGAASAWIGSTLKIKPILTLEREITPVERVRTRSRAFERLVEYAGQRHESGADGWVVQHIQAEQSADELVHRCREIFGCEPAFVSEVGPVLGSHVGPGLLGVGSVPLDVLR